jgi:Putative addiction module component
MSAILSPPASEIHERIRALSIKDKIDLLGAIEEDIEKSDPPAWQLKILAKRERDLAEGNTAFMPWDQAKKQIRERLGL